MENNELEEMKAQLALLNEKLEKEHIVNEKLTKETLRNKTRLVNTNKYFILVVDGLCMVFGPALIWYLRMYNFPIWLGFLAIAVTAFDFFAQLVLFNKLNLNSFTNENVVNSIKKFKDFKKYHKILLTFEWGITAIAFISIFLWASQILSKQGLIIYAICLALLIPLGIWSVTSRQKKIYSTCDKIIEQLEEKV